MTEGRARRQRAERPERRERAPRRERAERPERDDERAVYVISVAAELAGVHPQTLRTYERLGLLTPSRTSGNTRLYSQHDIEVLRTIQDLTQGQGINLAGVKVILAMRVQMEAMQARAARRAEADDESGGSTGLARRHDFPAAPWSER